jgi:hypothetical protein
MDRDNTADKEFQLDLLLNRASASVMQVLDATVDVPQRLHDLLRQAGVEPSTSHIQRLPR